MKAQGTNLLNSFDIPSNSMSATSNATKNTDGVSFRDLLNKRSNLGNDLSSIATNTKELNKSNTEVKEKNTVEFSNKKVDKTTSNEIESDDSTTNLNEKVSKLVEEVKDVIKEKLDISEEELNSIMEMLGLTMADLFQVSSLQQIVLTSAGNDDLMLMLTDENLGNVFKDLMGMITDLIETSEIPLDALNETLNSEEFMEFLKQETTNSQDLANMLDLNEAKLPLADQMVVDEAPMEDDVNNVEESSTSDESNSIHFTVERSTDSKEAGNMANDDSQMAKDEFATVDNFLDQVATSIAKTETNFSGELTTITTIREIANQIIEQIKVVIKPDQTSMQMQLNPEQLGKVALNITAKEGIMTALFTTQTEMAKEAIENQMHVLRQNLENQGIQVEVIEVTVAEFSFNQSNEAGNKKESGSNKGKKAFRMELEEDVKISNDSSILASGLVDETVSSIDFSA